MLLSYLFPEEEKVDIIENDDNSVIIGPFRFIKPYKYTFQCSAKSRWCSKPLVDTFLSEFKHWTKDVIVKRINDGDIVVNGKRIPVDYTIKNGDKIEHTITRIEIPVYNEPIEVLGENDEFIAYLKPASVPVHESGGFLFNSLGKRVGDKYYPLHRLDKVTSGIIIMGKSEAAANKFRGLLETGNIKKTYLARVIGEFPHSDIVVNEPIEMDHCLNRMVVSKKGKESTTEFRLIKTNGKESIVECHPITGRTHQIRIHLSYLGYPISNDELYGGSKQKYTKEELKALDEARKHGYWPPDTSLCDDDPVLEMKIYLHSVHYQSEHFDFHAPFPKWFDLDYREDGNTSKSRSCAI